MPAGTAYDGAARLAIAAGAGASVETSATTRDNANASLVPSLRCHNFAAEGLPTAAPASRNRRSRFESSAVNSIDIDAS
jgi:hypothetical protein